MTVADETCTIRTSTGQLFGRFTSRDEAWAVIERIRRDPHHRDSVHAANVVPLLIGTMVLPVAPAWLGDVPSDDQPRTAPENLTHQEVMAAVDSLVSTYNDSRSAHLGYRYVSQTLLGSDRHLQAAVAAVLAGCRFELGQLTAERDRLQEHSVTLNSVAFAMAEALGDVPPGADSVEGDPLEQVRRLVDGYQMLGDALKIANGTTERRTAQLHDMCDEVERLTKHSNMFRSERDAARAELEQLRAEADASGRTPVIS